MAHAGVRGSVVAAVLAEFERIGGDAEALLGRHHVPRTLLDDPHTRIALARYVAMFEDMAVHLDDPLLGARLGLTTRPVELGPAGLMIGRSRSIAAALDRLTRFITSFQPGTQSALTRSEGMLVWTYRIREPGIWPRRQDAEFTISSLIQLIRAGFVRDWRPLLVQFEHAPVSVATKRSLERMLGCAIRFEASGNGLLIPLDEAKRPFRDEDRDLITVLESYLADLMLPDGAAGSWTEKVQALIAAYLGQQPVTLEHLAADLSIAPRSLQRRLAQEGMSLRRLLREHRQELAGQHLQAGTARLASLAEALGYADATTFWRAHRRWTGRAPSAMRARIDRG